MAPKKSKFEVNISIDRLCLQNIRTVDLKRRMKWILSMTCDVSTAVNIRFCDIAEMRASNLRFRRKDYATDVLSFPTVTNSKAGLGRQTTAEFLEMGDILVCVPVCAKQAKKFRHSLSEELEKMLIHGIVHLKGFDHERGEEAWQIMSCVEKSVKKGLVRQFGGAVWCAE